MKSTYLHRIILKGKEYLVILKINLKTGKPESYFIPNQNNKLKLT